jgi:hypothetical protein
VLVAAAPVVVLCAAIPRPWSTCGLVESSFWPSSRSPIEVAGPSLAVTGIALTDIVLLVADGCLWSNAPT